VFIVRLIAQELGIEAPTDSKPHMKNNNRITNKLYFIFELLK